MIETHLSCFFQCSSEENNGVAPMNLQTNKMIVVLFLSIVNCFSLGRSTHTRRDGSSCGINWYCSGSDDIYTYYVVQSV